MNSYYIYDPKKKNGNWILRVRRKRDKKDFQKSFDASKYSKSEVQKLAKQIEAKDLLRDTKDPVYDPFNLVNDTPNVMLGFAVEQFLKAYKIDVKTKTYNFNKSVLNNFLEVISEQNLVDLIPFRDIKSFIDSSCEKSSSKNQYLTPFKNLYSFLNKEFNIDYTPEFQKFEKSQQDKADANRNPEVLNENELWELLQTAKNLYGEGKPHHIEDIHSFIIYFYTGLRTEELAHIKIRDIDLDTERLIVGRNKSTKTYKSRSIWLPEQAHEALEFLMEGKGMDDYLIDHSREDGTGRIMRSTYYVFTRCFKKTFPRKNKMPLYNLRHSCGCWLLENLFSIEFVKDQLGHSNIEQVFTYVQMTSTKMDNEITAYKNRTSNVTNLNTSVHKIAS